MLYNILAFYLVPDWQNRLLANSFFCKKSAKFRLRPILVEKVLAKEQLTGSEKGKYLIILMVLGFFSRPFALVSPIYSRPPLIVQGINLATVVVSVLIIVYGIKRCLKINEGIDHRNFIERFVILSVPVSVKILILGVPSSFALLWIMFGLFSRNHPNLYQFVPGFFYIISPIVAYIYYFFLRRSFVRFGQLMKEKEQTTTVSG